MQELPLGNEPLFVAMLKALSSYYESLARDTKPVHAQRGLPVTPILGALTHGWIRLASCLIAVLARSLSRYPSRPPLPRTTCCSPECFPAVEPTQQSTLPFRPRRLLSRRQRLPFPQSRRNLHPSWLPLQGRMFPSEEAATEPQGVYVASASCVEKNS